MDNYLFFQTISRDSLRELVLSMPERPFTSQVKQDFFISLDEVIQLGSNSDQNPTIKAEHILDAINLLRLQHSNVHTTDFVESLNNAYKNKFGVVVSPDEIKNISRKLVDELAKKANIPLELLPEIQLVDDSSCTNQGLASTSETGKSGSYNSDANIIFIYPSNLQSRTTLASTVAHEFRHFLNDLEVRKLKIQEPEIFYRTIHKLAEEQQTGKDLALGYWAGAISAEDLLQVVNHQVTSNELAACVKRKLNQYIMEQIRKVIKLDFKKTVNPVDFLHQHQSNLAASLSESEVQAIEKHNPVATIVNVIATSIIEDFNRNSIREKYAGLSKLDASQTSKAVKLSKGLIQAKFERSKLKDPKYNRELYLLNEEEVSARLYENTNNLRMLLKQNLDLCSLLRNRPNPDASVDKQPESWLNELSLTLKGQRLLELVTSIRAHSLLLCLSRDLRQGTVILEEDISKLIDRLKEIDQQTPDDHPFGKDAVIGVLQYGLDTNNHEKVSQFEEAVNPKSLRLENELLRLNRFAVSHGFMLPLGSDFGRNKATSLRRPLLDFNVEYFRDQSISTLNKSSKLPLIQYIVLRARESMREQKLDISGLESDCIKGEYRAALIKAWNLGEKEDKLRAYVKEWDYTPVSSHNLKNGSSMKYSLDSLKIN